MNTTKFLTPGGLFAAVLLFAGQASAFPLSAGQSAIGAAGDDTLVIQTQCGPGGCAPSGSQPARRSGAGTYVPGRGSTSRGDYYDLWGLGAGIATGLITEQMMRERQPSNSAYAENYCGRKGLVPQILPSGRFKCVAVR
jgi:hypothetical protein